MKPRERGFISEDKIDHDGELFDYIRELHEYLWRVIRAVRPGASGSLCNFLDEVIEKLEETPVDRASFVVLPRCEFPVGFDKWAHLECERPAEVYAEWTDCVMYLCKEHAGRIEEEER